MKIVLKNIYVNKKTHQGEISILENIYLELNSGKLYFLCGPNGSGKSTLIKVLAGIEEYSRGEKVIESKKIVVTAYVPSQLSIYQPFLVSDVIAILKKEYKSNNNQLPQFEEEKIYNQFKIFSIEKKNVNYLSSGEMKRLSIYLALLKNPDMLLLDEVEANADPDLVYDIFSFLKTKKNLLILAASHQISTVMNFADEILILNHKHHFIFQGKNKQLAKKVFQKLYNSPFLFKKL